MQITPAELDDEEEGDGDTVAGMMGLRFDAKEAALEGTRKKETTFTQRGSMYRFNPKGDSTDASASEGAAAAPPAASPRTQPPVKAVAAASAPAPAPAAAAAAPAPAYDGSKHSYEVLKAAKPGGGLDIVFTAKEMYLSDADFETVFKMARAAFEAQPKWKKDDQKKKAGLF